MYHLYQDKTDGLFICVSLEASAAHSHYRWYSTAAEAAVNPAQVPNPTNFYTYCSLIAAFEDFSDYPELLI